MKRQGQEQLLHGSRALIAVPGAVAGVREAAIRATRAIRDGRLKRQHIIRVYQTARWSCISIMSRTGSQPEPESELQGNSINISIISSSRLDFKRRGIPGFRLIRLFDLVR